MSLLAVQTILARLYTDSAFRARFFDVPEQACSRLGLTEAEKQQLLALDRRQVERFARSLRQKRLGAVRELLPGTAHAMGDGFGAEFFRYREGRPSALERVEEARAFASYLLEWCDSAGADQGLPGYFADLVVAERYCLEVLYPPVDDRGPSPGVASPVCTLDACPRLTLRAQVAAFQYDLEVLYPKLLRGEGEEALPDPCFILIGKVRGALRARLKRVNDATARLLLLCDGTRRLAEIVEQLAATLRLSAAERAVFAAECARFVAPLLENGLIEI